MLVERATEVLSPISNKMNLIMKDIPELDKILDNGASKAKSIGECLTEYYVGYLLAHLNQEQS